VFCTIIYCFCNFLCRKSKCLIFNLILKGQNVVWSSSAASIATRYGLYSPGIEPRWGQDFPHSSRAAEAHPASYTIGTGSLLGVKQPVHGADNPPTSSAEVKERVELYLHSHSGPLWSAVGWTFLLPLPSTQPPTAITCNICPLYVLSTLLVIFRNYE
jgi:hypothetical protein